MNEFKLSPMERKQVLADAKALTSQSEFKIKHYKESVFKPGLSNSSDSSWSDFKYYKSVIQEVDTLTKKRYSFGDIKEGDIIVLLPFDTPLPEADKYVIKFNGRNYTAINKKKAITLLDGTITHYELKGRL